jgi:vacuolar-type H+-ATPase subunit E/Vma4
MTLTNRQQLISDYVDQVLDNMSTKDLVRIVAEQLEENLAKYSDEELLTEITEYFPELLEDSDA